MRRAKIISIAFMFASVCARGAQVCTVDLNGNGSIDTAAESQACIGTTSPFLCPIGAQACVDNGSGPTCPSNPARPCVPNGAGTLQCSLIDCFDSASVTPVLADPTANADPVPIAKGPDNSCAGELHIFPGASLRCRLAGTQTLFKNCCSDASGQSLNDTIGNPSESVKQSMYISLMGQAAAIAVTNGAPDASSFLESNFDPGTLQATTMTAAIVSALVNLCDQRDIQTGQLQESGYCVEIGEYCGEKWPLVGCVQNDRAYCCFNSILARIIHQQGRPQIPSMGGFGTPDAPNCRGFTVKEFQSLDFSKIDFSEYADELRHRAQSQMQTDVQTRATTRLGGP